MITARCLTRSVGYVNLVRRCATTVKKTVVAEPNKPNSKTKIKSSAAGTAFEVVEDVLQKATQPKPTAEQMPRISVAENVSGLITNIRSATTLEDVLNFSKSPRLSKGEASAILAKISGWLATEAIHADDFKSDTRFLTVCERLAQSAGSVVEKLSSQKPAIRSKRLDMIMNVTGDQQAADICVKLPLHQNLQVLSNLAHQKSRGIVVLRAIAQSIVAHPKHLDLKQCSDVYFAIGALNFTDEVLLAKLGGDVVEQLKKNTDKMAAVGSIVTSLGMLRYRDANVLNALTKWIIERHEKCRPKDLVSLLMTLALVDFPSKHVTEIKSTILPRVVESDMTPGEWLNYVWALCVLGLQQPSHLESVLKPGFAATKTDQKANLTLNPAQVMKILNVNAAAKHLTENYTGPLVEPSAFEFQFGYRKTKKALIDGLIDTSKNLFNSESNIRTGFDTGMGFVIDAECVLSKSRLPLPVNEQHTDASRIAMMVLDFHDYCRGDVVPNGFIALPLRLLQKNGYNVLLIPHTEFNNSDKVLKRVQYLDGKLKDIVGK